MLLGQAPSVPECGCTLNKGLTSLRHAKASELRQVVLGPSSQLRPPSNTQTLLHPHACWAQLQRGELGMLWRLQAYVGDSSFSFSSMVCLTLEAGLLQAFHLGHSACDGEAGGVREGPGKEVLYRLVLRNGRGAS